MSVVNATPTNKLDFTTVVPSPTDNTLTDTSITPQTDQMLHDEKVFSPMSPDPNDLSNRVYLSEDEMDHDLKYGPRFSTGDENAPTKEERLTKHIPSPMDMMEEGIEEEESGEDESSEESDDDDDNLANIKPKTWKGWFILQGAKVLDFMDNLGGRVLGSITPIDNPYEDAKYIVEKEREAQLEMMNEEKATEIILEEMKEEIMEEVEEGEVRPDSEQIAEQVVLGNKTPQKSMQQTKDNPKAAYEV